VQLFSSEDHQLTCTIYPPPSGKDIEQIYFISEINRLIAILQSGTICVYKIDGNKAFLDRLIKRDDILDQQGKPFNQSILCTCVVSNYVVKYDCGKQYEFVPDEVQKF
jgi:hypothetical protein